VIGSGISGLLAAYLLRNDYEVTLYEKRGRLGGHSHTVDVEIGGRDYPVDTGFIVFNDRTYPNFIKLLSQLGVSSIEAPMSFGVRSDRSGLEYAVTSIDSLFAQRRNTVSPSYLRLLVDIMRWNRLAIQSRGAGFERVKLRDFLKTQKFSDLFVSEYLYPLGSSIWSCSAELFGEFPVGFLTGFLHNHGMLAWAAHPQWRTVVGGSRTYVDAIANALRDSSVHLASEIVSVRRYQDRVDVVGQDGAKTSFDHVILACHADDALAMLADPSDLETEIVGTFAYQDNEVVLHTDPSEMPKRRKAWAAWNYHVCKDSDAVSLTYWMNALQSLDCPEEIFVTVNPQEPIRHGRRIREFQYRHPQFSIATSGAQQRHGEVINSRRTSFCGAYWGFGFHEDGVRSTLAVGDAFGVSL